MSTGTVVDTAAGVVEVLYTAGENPPVLFFPGGHCSATTDCGWEIYAALGHGVISFSRPGYRATRVGALSAAQFVPSILEVCVELGVVEVAAVVGVSFGGLQAVHLAADGRLGVSRLVLHSCAPSSLPWPDSRGEMIGGPIAFSPLLEGLVWSTVRRVIRSEAGLRRMMATLSRQPVDEWWSELTATDKEQARSLFNQMRSGGGFTIDLRQGHRAETALRRAAISRVACPTLVTASRMDAGVSFSHAEDFAATIPTARLVEIDAPSHLFWIGHGRAATSLAVSDFLRT